MAELKVKASYEALRERVLAVARLYRLCAMGAGFGRLAWRIGLPLLAVLLLQLGVTLPFWLRAPILPAALALGVWWGWRDVMRPMLQRYTVTRAAMLVEAGIPELKSRVVTALELYPELEAGAEHFDPVMVGTVVVYAQASTAEQDFAVVVDRRTARRHMAGAGIVLLAWVVLFAAAPQRAWQSLLSMATAWNQVGQLLQKAGGAKIEVPPLDKPAYLVGSDVVLRAVQKDFHRDLMDLLFKPEKASAWQRVPLKVDAAGRAAFTLTNAQETVEFYFAADLIESPHRRAVITERPRIVKLSVEYDLPEYVQRAPVVQPNSDGSLKVLYGSTVTLTLEASKNLAGAQIVPSFAKSPEVLNLGGRFARAILRLDRKEWLASTNELCHETYRLVLKDEYGFTNADADKSYPLDVERDQAPSVGIIGIPNRSSDEEPHVLEDALARIVPLIQAKDDYGIRKITVHCKLEDLETNAEKGKADKEKQFPLPVADVPRLRLLALNELGAKVGDRVVYWAEVEDAYDLEPGKGPHQARTPRYRFAVVSQEELFSEIRYNDTWSVQWYDKKKVATLSQREEAPKRMSAESEPGAQVALRLLDAPPAVDAVRGSDQQLVQDYYDSLNSMR